MQFSKIMLAVGALAAGASAVAAPSGDRIAYSTGASALRNNLASALGTRCTAAGGTLQTFAGATNVFTYVCRSGATALTTGTTGTYQSGTDAAFINFQATQFSELRLNVAAGSFGAIRGLNNVFTDDLAADLLFRDPGLSTAGQDRTRAELLSDRTTTIPTIKVPVYVGGLLDVQPTAFPADVRAPFPILGAVAQVGVQQAFGVAVSSPLYTAMFNSQKSLGAASIAKPIPSTCAVTDTANPTCVPTISKGQMAAIMSNNDANTAYASGANFLASTLTAGTELRYIRRVNTSGTQAAAQNYFLGLPCSAVANPVVDEPAATEEIDTQIVAGFETVAVDLKDTLIGAIRVVAAPGTGDVRRELNKTTTDATGTNYSIGIVSGENNQTSGTDLRWLRVQGAPMTENAAPNNGQTNRATVIDGSYDFWFDAVVATPTAGGGVAANFFGPVSTTLKTLGGTGLVREADQKFSKGGNSCQFNSSK